MRTRARAVKLLTVAAVVFAVSSSSGCTRLTARVTTVNGRDVELVTAGTGERTVVFESGLGSDWGVWDATAVEVARSTRVFAYSRPGAGRSAPATTRRDASTIVEELRALLAAEGYRPPYVLVGHSFGGTYMELFARAHPDEVTGLVLVDARPADFLSECEARHLDGCGISASAAKSLARVEQEELAAFAEASSQLRAAGGFGRVPVRVLTATAHSGSEAWEALWRSMHAAIADEADDGEQIVFEGVGHHLELERTADVARIILERVEAREAR